MKTSDCLILSLDKETAKDESKMENIGYSYEEFIAKKNNVWGASYQNFIKVGDNDYQFHFLLKHIE